MRILFRAMSVLILAALLVGCGVAHAHRSEDLLPAEGDVNEPAEGPVAEAPPEGGSVDDDPLPLAPESDPDTQLTEYGPVAIPELGLTLEVPQGAARLEPLYEWAVVDVPEGRLGFSYTKFEPPMGPEAVLPGPSVSLGSEPVSFPWGEGRYYLVEVYGEAPPADEGETQAPVESVEKHIVVTSEVEGKRYFLDFYAGAPTAEGLAAIEPLLQRVVESVTLQ
jgi:hypothetical protein